MYPALLVVFLDRFSLNNLACHYQKQELIKEASFQILTQTQTSSPSPELKGEESRGGSLLHTSPMFVYLSMATLVWSKTRNGFVKKIFLNKTFNGLNSMFIKFHCITHFS